MRKLKRCVGLFLLSAVGCSTGNGVEASAGAGAGGSGSVSNGGQHSGGSGPVGAGGSGGHSSPSGGSGGTGSVGAASGGSSSGGASGSGASGSGGATAGSAGQSGAVNAEAMAPDLGFGANIGNTFDNTTEWEVGWGQPLVTQAFINGMAAHGIKSVRVPVAWDTYAANGVIDPAKMNRVKEVVGWIEAAGMYSIVNIHWDGGWIDNETNSQKYRLTDTVKTKFASYWKQIGMAFSGVGHKLIFEGLNEEGRFYVNGDQNQGPDYPALNELNQLFVTTVRALGGYDATRALLIAGFNTDLGLTCVDAFKVPSDPAGPGKLFLSIHYYSPSTFTILEDVASWGTPATTWGTSTERATLDSDFTKLASCSSNKKIPIIIGEFGVTRGEKYVRDPASRTLWMQSVANAAHSRGMVPVLWDTGSEIHRSDGSFSTELQNVMTHFQ
jgi:endoglucanase